MSQEFSVNINTFDGGFVIEVTSLTVTGLDTVEISQYELSRNNIAGNKVKAVKAYNTGNVDPLWIITDSDTVQFPVLKGGVQPLNIGRGSLKIMAFWGSPYSHKIVCYYDKVSNYIMDVTAF